MSKGLFYFWLNKDERVKIHNKSIKTLLKAVC